MTNRFTNCLILTYSKIKSCLKRTYKNIKKGCCKLFKRNTYVEFDEADEYLESDKLPTKLPRL